MFIDYTFNDFGDRKPDDQVLNNVCVCVYVCVVLFLLLEMWLCHLSP